MTSSSAWHPKDIGAAWRGAEWLARPESRVKPPNVLWEELERGARGEGAGGEASQVATLAKRIQMDLEEGPGAVLLTGMPVERWGDERAAAAFERLAWRIGAPLSQSSEGTKLFRVRDEGFAPNDPRFRGPSSNKKLSFHTDRCDVIAFLCLRPARQGGETSIVSSVALYEEIARRHPEALEALRTPLPYLRHTVDEGNPLPYCMLPVFSECEGRFAAHFLRVLIERADRAAEAPSLSAAQREALDILDRRAEDPALHVSIDLAPGDMLFLNNWVTLHRREAFVDHDDPRRRRELLRIWLSVPNSRPIAACFRDHFGACEAGRLRGGMRPL